MWTYDDTRAAIRDALRLSRAMTFKAAVAGLPLGGGKGVIMLPRRRGAARRRERRDALLDFGDAVDALGGALRDRRGRRHVRPRHGGDRRARTHHVAGLAVERGGSGDPSPWTALGVEAAMRVACERVFGTADLAGRSVAVVGLGQRRRPARRAARRGRRRARGHRRRPEQARARGRARRATGPTRRAR